jgi:hypothetical protein
VCRVSSQVSVFVVAVALAVLAAPGGAALAASPEGGPIVRVAVDLKTNNDLHAHLETSEDGTVTLEFRRQGQIVSYEVPGVATEAGLKVRFGKRGTIDVAFTPTKTLNSTEPGPGCTGAPRTLREGVFSGTIDFAGERRFVRIEGPQASGSMSVISPWECPEAEATDPFARASRLFVPAEAGVGRPVSGRDSATVYAANGKCSCSFAAGVRHRHSGGRSVFLGLKIENREGMKIRRATQVRAPGAAFDFDRAVTEATLRPPAPFSGRATFEAGSKPHDPGTWRSTIEVPLLGADPIDTSAPGFEVYLVDEYQFG